jgi:hypothetical protein
LIDAHRGAFEYDWRARFSLPLTVVGKAMSWGEAYRLTQELAGDPESHVSASLSGWERAVPQAAMVLMDLYDLTHQIGWKQFGGKGPKPKPYPRPWPTTKTGRHKAKPDESLTQDEIVAALRAAGHTAPLPTRAGGESDR